eukprot:304440-Prorocentrum_minimum.AAC.3
MPMGARPVKRARNHQLSLGECLHPLNDPSTPPLHPLYTPSLCFEGGAPCATRHSFNQMRGCDCSLSRGVPVHAAPAHACLVPRGPPAHNAHATVSVHACYTILTLGALA